MLKLQGLGFPYFSAGKLPQLYLNVKTSALRSVFLQTLSWNSVQKKNTACRRRWFRPLAIFESNRLKIKQWNVRLSDLSIAVYQTKFFLFIPQVFFCIWKLFLCYSNGAWKNWIWLWMFARGKCLWSVYLSSHKDEIMKPGITNFQHCNRKDLRDAKGQKEWNRKIQKCIFCSIWCNDYSFWRGNSTTLIHCYIIFIKSANEVIVFKYLQRIFHWCFVK